LQKGNKGKKIAFFSKAVAAFFAFGQCAVFDLGAMAFLHF